MPQPSVFKGVQDFPLPAFKPLIPSAGLSKATLAASRRPFQGNSRPQEPVPVIHRFSWTFCSGTCHLLFLHGFPACFKPFRRPFQGNSHSYRPQPSVFKGVQLPFARLQTATGPSHLFLRAKPLKTLPQAFPRQLLQLPTSISKATPAATCPRQCFKPFRKPFHSNSRSYRPQPSAFKDVQDCRLPALKPLKPSRQAFPRQLLQLPASISKATLAATWPRQCFKPFRKPFQSNSRSYRPQPSVFKGVQDCHLPTFKPLQAPAICF